MRIQLRWPMSGMDCETRACQELVWAISGVDGCKQAIASTAMATKVLRIEGLPGAEMSDTINLLHEASGGGLPVGLLLPLHVRGDGGLLWRTTAVRARLYLIPSATFRRSRARAEFPDASHAFANARYSVAVGG